MHSPPEHFLEMLRQYGVTDRIVAAFAAIPRSCFVTGFYERVPTGKRENAYQYKTRELVGEPQWTEMLYQNRSLITQLAENNMPASSSSQPSIMAQILEASGITPGQRVLEIGTGTGYNAAILAHLVGSPRLITTIDIDPILIEQATPRIQALVGEGMTIVAGDGLQGFPAQAPYDHIIVTGSYHAIPHTWLEQLSPGGKLLMNYHRHFGNAILLLQKDHQGRINGTIPPIDALFMPLHHGVIEEHIPPVRLTPISPALGTLADSPLHPEHFKVKEEFAFFAHCHFPHMAMLRFWKGDIPYTFLADYTTRRIVQFYQDTIRGSSTLWQELLLLYQEWKQRCCPHRSSYTFTVENNQQWVILNKERWRLGEVA